MYINRYYINLIYKIYREKYNYKKIRHLYSFIFYASCIKGQIIRLFFSNRVSEQEQDTIVI